MASRGINRVIIIGNVGQDPEIRYMQSGDAVANISLATSEQWKDKNTGEQKEKTEWHRAVFFGRIAEIVGEYVTKGMTIYVEGSLQTRKWTDKDGVEKYTTEIKGANMQMLSSGQRKDQQGGQQSGGYAEAKGKPARSQPVKQEVVDVDFDDDIAF